MNYLVKIHVSVATDIVFSAQTTLLDGFVHGTRRDQLQVGGQNEGLSGRSN
jgi:hypothetical protein